MLYTIRFAFIAALAAVLAPFVGTLVAAMLGAITLETAASVFCFYVVQGFALILFPLFVGFAVCDCIGRDRGIC